MQQDRKSALKENSLKKAEKSRKHRKQQTSAEIAKERILADRTSLIEEIEKKPVLAVIGRGKVSYMTLIEAMFPSQLDGKVERI